MKIWIFWLLFWGIVLSGCMTQNKFNRIASEHKDWLSEQCSEEFPAKDVYLPGKTDTVTKTVVRRDSVIVTREVVRDGKTVTEYVKIPCPECRCEDKIVTRIDTIVRLDSAKVYLYQSQANKASEAAKKAIEKADNRTTQRNWLAVALLIAVGLLFLKIRGLF